MSYKDNTLIHTIFVRCEISSDFFLINGIDNVMQRLKLFVLFYMQIPGIFIIVKDKESSLEQFNKLKERYGNLHGGYNLHQEVRLCKAYCHDLQSAIRECFESEMYGPQNCLKKLALYQKNDDPSKVSAISFQAGDIASGLYTIINNSVPIKDFPSCKKLSELSIDDAVSAINDLGKNKIVKVAVCSILLGKKIYDRIQISDIESFYKERICELETELHEIERPAIDMEEYLLMKFKAELGYCQKARIITGLGAVKEIVGIIGNIDDAIENYEMSERLTFTMKS